MISRNESRVEQIELALLNDSGLCDTILPKRISVDMRVVRRENQPKGVNLMSAEQDVAMRRSISELSNEEAKAFLLKRESYLNFELPPYFRFESLLNEVAPKLKRNFSFKKHCNNASKMEKVNYTILNNKDGRYSWRPYELIHPVLYVSLVNQMTKRDSWLEIVTRFQGFSSSPKISCLSVPVQSLTPETDKAEQIKQWWEKVEQKSIELSLDFEFVVHTDLVDCYAAIYTHSIAWALHTKEVAKANRNEMGLIGNVIDFAHSSYETWSKLTAFPRAPS